MKPPELQMMNLPDKMTMEMLILSLLAANFAMKPVLLIQHQALPRKLRSKRSSLRRSTKRKSWSINKRRLMLTTRELPVIKLAMLLKNPRIHPRRRSKRDYVRILRKRPLRSRLKQKLKRTISVISNNLKRKRLLRIMQLPSKSKLRSLMSTKRVKRSTELSLRSKRPPESQRRLRREFK